VLVFNYAVTTDTESPQLFPNSSPGTYEGGWGGKFTVKARNIGTNTIWYGPAGSAIGATAGYPLDVGEEVTLELHGAGGDSQNCQLWFCADPSGDSRIALWVT
jgi:hypothetical protein